VLSPIDVHRHGLEGPPVVVLHGGPGAPGSVAVLADALSDEFAVGEPWQRRAGETPLTVAGHVADLAEVVDEPAHVVGWSWGAMLGLSFTVAHPERVRSLVLVGCGTYDEASRAEYEGRMRERLGSADRTRAADLRARLVARAQGYDTLDDVSPPVVLDVRGHEETWADVLRLQAEGVEPAAFAAITCPVLMLHGDTDPHPGQSTRDVLRRSVPQVEYVELSRCGHAPWLERHARDEFLRELRAWLHAH
jgi:pimeloyl-ACP methyl ester carboxylesterase